MLASGSTPSASSKFLQKTNKRKSRTPLKSRLRQSRAAANTTKAISHNTTKSTTTTTTTKSLKTAKSPKPSKYKVPTKIQQQQNSDESNDTTLTQTVSSKASTTASSTVNASSYRNKGYPFKQINTNDINYHEFTTHLQKPFKFNGSNNNSGGSTLSHHADKDIKDKLTSTLIMN